MDDNSTVRGIMKRSVIDHVTACTVHLIVLVKITNIWRSEVPQIYMTLSLVPLNTEMLHKLRFAV